MPFHRDDTRIFIDRFKEFNILSSEVKVMPRFHAFNASISVEAQSNASMMSSPAVTCGFNRFHDKLIAASVDDSAGSKPPSSPTLGFMPALDNSFFSWWKISEHTRRLR